MFRVNAILLLSTIEFLVNVYFVAATNQCPVKDFVGKCFDRDRSDPGEYEKWCYQYASTSMSYDKMKPKLILVPTGDDDVKRAIEYAHEHRVNIAVRTGGHQYSGASSTDGENIQLDMSEAYKDKEKDFIVERIGEDVFVHVGISFALLEFNTMLGNEGLFVPAGQCSNVHLGGHVQTGGYGQLARAFGLFADHVQSFDIITAKGESVHVKRHSPDKKMRDLFYAVLGGSPGNFGVLTHITLKVHRDQDHPHSRGYRAAYIYEKENLANVLELVAKMSDRDRDYDLCVSVLTADARAFPHHWFKSHYNEEDLVNSFGDEYQRFHNSDRFGHEGMFPYWPSTIIIYAQWANTGGPAQKPGREVEEWFESIKDAFGSLLDSQRIPDPMRITPDDHTPLSKLTAAWVFQDVREYLSPYEKRNYITNWDSKKLLTRGWPQWTADRIDEIQSKSSNVIENSETGCKLSVQIQKPSKEKSSK